MADRRVIPLAAMEKLMKKAGAERVSEDAKDALSEALEDYGIHIADAAKKYALHAGRKTIKAEDIKLAKR
jgi:histone H3/H4